MAIESKLQLEKYQYGIDVQKTRQLYGMSGKILYDGRWISRGTDRIIIVEMNGAIAEHEGFFYRELNGHDHIIRTFGYVENPLNSTIFVQEYAQHSDLANFFWDNQMTTYQTMFIEIFSQIADAMSYVASKSIVHGDLGCRNVLVYRIDPSDPKNTLVKLTDFGLARSLHRPPSTHENSFVIPIRYCAPEILRDNNPSNYSEKSDVYSMGVLIWEALSNGEIPYSSIPDDNNVETMKLKNEKLPRPPASDRQFWILMEKCWCFDPEERINFQQINEQLSEIIISELSDIQLSILPPIHCEYQLNVDVRMNELLNGSYDKTYAGEWISKKERPIVLMKMDKQPTEYEILFYTEFKSHRHIVHTFGFVENDLQSTILLQERAPHSNLQLLLQNNQFQPSPKVLIEIFLQIISAMIYITEHNLVHGDLRCANVLVFQMNNSNPTENLVKLTNFTSVHQKDPSAVIDRRTTVPVRYCAPEILRSAGRTFFSEYSDAYAMGVLMWEACSHGQIPYTSSILSSEVRQRKLNGEKLSMPWLCNSQIWSVMEDCWYNEPELRYDFEGMKIRLLNINPQSENVYQYEMNVDVKIGNRLAGKFGKEYYEAEWIPRKDRSILFLIMNDETAKHEVPFYQQCHHAHIVQTFGLVRNNPRLTTLVQERALHGNLQTLLQNNQFQPSSSVLVKIFLQIIDAMTYLVDQMIIHGDLRCENVLVFQMHSSKPKKNLVKLTNFNLARRNDPSFVDTRRIEIPVQYCAPELLQNTDQLHYSELSDVYSMGTLMWEAYSKRSIPYRSSMNDGERLLQPTGCDDQIWNIIQDCWHNEPQLRFNFREMHTLLSNISIICPPERVRIPLHRSRSNHTEDRPSKGMISPLKPTKSELPINTQNTPSNPKEQSTFEPKGSFFSRLLSMFSRKPKNK